MNEKPNEKPDCPCCQLSDTAERRTIPIPSESHNGWRICFDCGCTWNPEKRRAQPAEAVDEAAEREAFEEWCAKENTVPRFKESYWKIWLARARGGN